MSFFERLFARLRVGGLSFYFVWADDCVAAASGRRNRACSLRDIFSALRARRLFFNLVWAACAAGGRWGPVRGCRPSEAPSALPPDDPAGLAVYFHSHGSAFKGLPYPTIPRGLRGFCSGSFLAPLGDLPARRAMPSPAFTLNDRPARVSHWLLGVSDTAIIVVEKHVAAKEFARHVFR